MRNVSILLSSDSRLVSVRFEIGRILFWFFIVFEICIFEKDTTLARNTIILSKWLDVHVWTNIEGACDRNYTESVLRPPLMLNKTYVFRSVTTCRKTTAASCMENTSMLFYSAHVKLTTRALIDFNKEQKSNDANLGLKLYYIF